jgi:hypothetical protein
MKLLGLGLLFLALLLLQGLVVTEAFYTSPGTQIQMNSNHPVVWEVKVPEYVQEETVIPSWFKRVFIG